MSGFVYLWFDRKYKRYYVGSHWGREDDTYICSSTWMRNSYNRRKSDFKRRIISRVISNREALLDEEQRWLDMIKHTEIKPTNLNPRYYNLTLKAGRRW